MRMPQGDARDFFTLHHAAYRTSPSHSRGHDLDLLVERLALTAPARILDAATGSGHTALRLAAAGHTVVGVDWTEAMLADARELARERGLTARTRFVAADVTALPFPDASFDAVTCRRAAHHFADIAAFLREARRVLVPGGRLGIVDMTAPADAIDALNALERVRDASHRTALHPEAWESAVREAGFAPLHVEVLHEEIPATEWLYPVSPSSPEGQEAWTRMASGRLPPSVYTPPDRFHKHRLVLVARRTATGA